MNLLTNPCRIKLRQGLIAPDGAITPEVAGRRLSLRAARATLAHRLACRQSHEAIPAGDAQGRRARTARLRPGGR